MSLSPNEMTPYIKKIKQKFDEAQTFLVKNGYSEIYGARPLARLIQLKIKEPIADYLLSNNTKSKILIKINLEKNNNKLKFNFITEKKKEKII